MISCDDDDPPPIVASLAPYFGMSFFNDPPFVVIRYTVISSFPYFFSKKNWSSLQDFPSPASQNPTQVRC